MKNTLLTGFILLFTLNAFCQDYGDRSNKVKQLVEINIQSYYRAQGYKSMKLSYDVSYHNGKIEEVVQLVENAYDYYLRRNISFYVHYIMDIEADTLQAIAQSYQNVSVDELHKYMLYLHPAGKFGDYYFHKDGKTVTKVILSANGLATKVEFRATAIDLPDDARVFWLEIHRKVVESEQKKKEEEEKRKQEKQRVRDSIQSIAHDLFKYGTKGDLNTFRRNIQNGILSYYNDAEPTTFEQLWNSSTGMVQFRNEYLVTYELVKKPNLSSGNWGASAFDVAVDCTNNSGDDSSCAALLYEPPRMYTLDNFGYDMRSKASLSPLIVNLTKGVTKVNIPIEEVVKVKNKNLPPEIIEILELYLRSMRLGRHYIEFVAGTIDGKRVCIYKKVYR